MIDSVPHSLAVSVVLVVIAASTSLTVIDRDVTRAWTKVPGDHVRGSNHEDMTVKMNVQLKKTEGLKYKACEDFTVKELMKLQKVLFQARDQKFQTIYEKTEDNRRLMAFGKLVTDLISLETVWQEELDLLESNPSMHNVTRDAKCHEAVMWYIHHVPASKRVELMSKIVLPLLPQIGCPHKKVDFEAKAPKKVVDKIFDGYNAGIGCAKCHASGQQAANHEYTKWPEELVYHAAGHGAFPFWDNSGPGCSSCNPSISGTSHIKVMYSAKQNAEILMHESCGDMSWVGGSNYPNKSPCNSLFTSTDGAFIYTPKAALTKEADGKFCCRMYNSGLSEFPGAVPVDWMKSMKYVGTKSGFKGDYYSGDVKVYTHTIGPASSNSTTDAPGLQFWYYESPDGKPVEQGEGCYQPNGQFPSRACDKMMPIVLFHDFNQSSFQQTTWTADDFAVPDVCKSTTLSCTAPN